ncbi:MAG: rhomboid family intramembrane serine protease [Chitinophagaceae bacterium]|nr:MAG: rhomboid family intramembrane serine protease [Chitinophagaceae bacterium]
MSRFQYYRPNQMPPVVKGLLITNVIVFIIQLMGDSYGAGAPIPFSLTMKLALWPIGAGFEIYQLATHMFTHGGFGHILFNMFALWTFGKMLETVWGPKRFLNFYLMCGLGAALVHLLVQYLEGGGAPTVGASGAIMGVFAACAYLFPNTEMYIMFIPVPVKLKWVAVAYIAIDLFGGFNPNGGGGIAHFAHLGGALTGFIIVLIWQKRGGRKRFY